MTESDAMAVFERDILYGFVRDQKAKEAEMVSGNKSANPNSYASG